MSIGAHELRPPKGATKSRKRIARGNSGSGGTYAGRGNKGQNSRAGGGVRLGFEGGQMPLYRKMHVMKGFNNKWRVAYQPVNLVTLERSFEDGDDVTPEVLLERRIVRHLRDGVKILGSGEITKKLNVTAHKFSGSAQAKIEAAGGSVVALVAPKAPKEVKEKKRAPKAEAKIDDSDEAAEDES
jgi:large subunit ribosomal protein L15